MYTEIRAFMSAFGEDPDFPFNRSASTAKGSNCLTYFHMVSDLRGCADYALRDDHVRRGTHVRHVGHALRDDRVLHGGRILRGAHVSHEGRDRSLCSVLSSRH